MIQNPTHHADGSICVEFDAATYTATAVKKAAYKFTDQAAILISTQDNKILASLTFTPDQTEIIKQQVVHGFCTEVLDQDLRESIAAQTELTRNLILAQAFSKTSLLEE